MVGETIYLAVAWSLAALVAVPVATVVFEILAAMCWRGRAAEHRVARTPVPSTVVLVPAHNEAAGIARTLRSVSAGLPAGFRILCVAHNCTDGTASVARHWGADVVEVVDDGTGGKPAALAAGLRALEAVAPDVVVVVDADCVVEKKAVEILARHAHAMQCPVMGTYLFDAARKQQKSTLSSLAILLKNFIRPLGLHVLGMPCLINGSGSAYPFRLLRDLPLGKGSIAEDYQMAIDLLRRGYPTRFVPQARIFGRLPARQATALTQRRRWEHGQLWLTFRTAPGLIWEGVVAKDVRRLALGLEVLVPPLAFLGMMWIAALAFTVPLLAFQAEGGPLLLLLIAGAALVIAILGGWLRFAGISHTLSALGALPGYLLWKLPLYRDYFNRRETRWMKTARD